MASVWLMVSVVVSVCLAVLGTTVNAHSTSAATAAPSVGEMILEKIEGLGELNQKLDQKLGSVQDDIKSIQSSCGAASGGSVQETPATYLLLEAMQEKLAAVEKQQRVTHAAMQTMEQHQEATESAMRVMKTDLEATSSALQSAQTLLNSRLKSGSTFVRWGRKTCTNNSQIVYSGVAGGSQHHHTGAAANLLCLTMTPQTDNTPFPSYYTFLYGSEYQHLAGHHDHDVPCSVCLAPQPTSIMVPGTRTCPLGWTTQYTGHLVAGYHAHPAATEYNCLDGSPEHILNGHLNHDGKLLYLVFAQCGSLPCPPYAQGKIVLCAVCSK